MTDIPAIYDPPLDGRVIACAQMIARDALARGDFKATTYDQRELYRHVRACMNRAPEVGTYLHDDESISEGIVRALNAARKV